MTLREVARISAFTVAAAVLVVACGKKPAVPPPPPPPPPAGAPPAAEKAEPITLTLTAAADVNPDANSRPSPVVIRVYQLKNDTAFNAASFFELFDDEKKVLASDLSDPNEKSVEVTLRPGETVPVPNFFMLPYTRFVAVIAAYRDIRNAQWKSVVPRSAAKTLTVSVARLRVELVAK